MQYFFIFLNLYLFYRLFLAENPFHSLERAFYGGERFRFFYQLNQLFFFFLGSSRSAELPLYISSQVFDSFTI